MNRNPKNKKRGFALVFTVIALAVIMGIFLNYSMSARARKAYKATQKVTSGLEKSVSQSIGLGIADAYTMDRVIVGKGHAVYDQMGYFIVKDITENNNSKTQEESEKIWEVGSGNQNSGIWYSVEKINTGGKEVTVGSDKAYLGGEWKFVKQTIPTSVRVSKGGYTIKSIKNSNTGAPLSLSSGIDPIQQELTTYWGTEANKNRYPTFEVTLYKNILYETESGKHVRDYDATVVLKINYFPMKKMQELIATEKIPVGKESRYAIAMQKNNVSIPIIQVPGTTEEVERKYSITGKDLTGTPIVNGDVEVEVLIDETAWVKKGTNTDKYHKATAEANCGPLRKVTPIGTITQGSSEEKTIPSVENIEDVTKNNIEIDVCAFDEKSKVYACFSKTSPLVGSTEGQEKKIEVTEEKEIKEGIEKEVTTIKEKTLIVRGKFKFTETTTIKQKENQCRIGSETSATGDGGNGSNWYLWTKEVTTTEKKIKSEGTAQILGTEIIERRLEAVMENGDVSPSSVVSYKIEHIGP